MKLRYTVIALPILICGATVAGAANASARIVDPDARHGRPPDAVVVQGPTVEVPVDDGGTEALQNTAAALAGAGLATAGVWFYRRRSPLAAH